MDLRHDLRMQCPNLVSISLAIPYTYGMLVYSTLDSGSVDDVVIQENSLVLWSRV